MDIYTGAHNNVKYIFIYMLQNYLHYYIFACEIISYELHIFACMYV